MKTRAIVALGILLLVILLAENGQIADLPTVAAPVAVSAEESASSAPNLASVLPSVPVVGNQSAETGATGARLSFSLIAISDGRSAPAVNPPTLDELRGKIIFFSDRGTPYPELYRMNPDGSEQRLCNCQSLFADIFFRETTSPTGAQFLYTKSADASQPGSTDSQIWMHDNMTGRDSVVTGAEPAFPGVDYDPVWSPTAKQVAWVTEAHLFAEIYRYDFATDENTLLTESNGEWNKHPSFSPDGVHVVFWRNAANADNRQIWVMDSDGTHKLNVSRNTFRDWDPIWVK